LQEIKTNIKKELTHSITVEEVVTAAAIVGNK
jgi:hypothetical protein